MIQKYPSLAARLPKDLTAVAWHYFALKEPEYDSLLSPLSSNGGTSDMLDALSTIRDRFREAWLMEFTPFRLNIALAKFDAELTAWWKLQRRLQELVDDLSNGLPPLETVTRGLW